MNVLIYCKVWRRPRITWITYLGILRIQQKLKQYGMSSRVLIVSSQTAHDKLAQCFGFDVFHTENSPLGAKQNRGLIRSLDYEWDYMFEMGSNNLLSDRYIEDWAQCATDGVKLFGSRTFHIQHESGEVHKFVCKPGKMSGVGRGIHRKLLEKVYKAYGKICSTTINKGLDFDLRVRIQRSSNTKPKILNHGDTPAIIDMKTGEDVNEHKLKKVTDHTTNDLQEIFPEIIHLSI